MNNNLDDSPIGLSNTAAGTPNSNDSETSPGHQRNSKQHAINSQFQILGEDLQKIRQSSHHSLHLQGAAARREIINDTELFGDVVGGGSGRGGGGGGGVRGLLYPALEDSFSDSQRSFGVDLMEDCDRYTQTTSAVGGGQTHTSHDHPPGSVMTSTSTMGSSSNSSSMNMSGLMFHNSTSSSSTPASTFLNDVQRGSTDSRQLTEYLSALRRVGRSSSSTNHFSSDPSNDKLRRR
jgi:hypothetical protein